MSTDPLLHSDTVLDTLKRHNRRVRALDIVPRRDQLWRIRHPVPDRDGLEVDWC